LNLQKREQGIDHLDLAEKLVNKGDYEGALKEDDAVVRVYPGVSPGDRALFHMGLIWAHPDNAGRDYKKALDCFQRLIKDFPGSALMEEVRVWVGAINELMLYEGRVRDREDTISVLKKQLDALKETDTRVEQKNKDLEETVKALKKQIKALKEIDLGIEEKKREDSSGKTNR